MNQPTLTELAESIEQVIPDIRKSHIEHYGVLAAVARELRARDGVKLDAPPSLTLDANEVRFLAARLRRLFQHFGAPVPGMEDDARLIGNAGAGIGLLLTGRTDGVSLAGHQTKSCKSPGDKGNAND